MLSENEGVTTTRWIYTLRFSLEAIQERQTDPQLQAQEWITP